MAELIPLDRIDPNPFQTRLAEDPAHLRALALDIARRGLLQEPVARRVGDRVQLAFGHTRRAALAYLNGLDDAAWIAAGLPADRFSPGQYASLPVTLRALEDRDMAEFAIAENAQRKNLTPIETARAARIYMQTFGASQVATAQLFGYRDGSALKHLLDLLDLPDPVQARVSDGSFPQRFARTGIYRALSRLAPARAGHLADQVAAVEEEKREEVYEQEVDSLLDQVTRPLRTYGLNWKLDWKPDPVLVAQLARADKGEPNPLPSPSCEGCQFHLRYRNHAYCVQPSCFDFKTRLQVHQLAVKAAKEKKVTLPAANEKVAPLWTGDPTSEAYAKKALAEAPDLLRIMPVAEQSAPGRAIAGDDWQKRNARERVLGAGELQLAVTDKKALEARIGKPAAAAKAKAQSEEERRQAQADRARKSEATRKHKWAQCVSMYRAAARHWSAGITVPDTFLNFLCATVALDDASSACRDLGKLSDLKGRARVEYVVTALLVEFVREDEWSPDPEACRDTIEELAEQLHFKLPAGWDDAYTAGTKNTMANAGRVDGDAKKWLVSTPSTDVNFKTTLKETNLATLKAALAQGIATKTARLAVEAQVRKLEKSAAT